MNRISIDRLDLSLDGLSEADAQQVRSELPGAMQRSLQRRMSESIAMRLDRSSADLGVLSLPGALPPRAVADAIAARLTDWLGTQAMVASGEEL
ncbi:hypothetical protein [Roseateles sp.]|uniref:hypothetical protein n=1 Tax=Roseateles sp. TaxID=1971397 RepID=UPI003266C162